MKAYPFYNSSNPLLSENKDLDIFLGKPFWCGNIASNNTSCCFNHIIGLPEKNDKTYPIFDYELDVIKAIESNRNIWIKKSAGIGATTILLRYLVWKILVNNDDLEYKNIFIVSGTHFRHANEVKIKMEQLFTKNFPFLKLESKFTDLWIKNTNIKIFPSRNVKDLRGYTDVAYLFIDEADYFEPSVNSELLHAITRYEEKSNCTTVMVSTPNRPDGLFQSIEKDPNSKYTKIILDYTVGLGKIYDPEEIKKKMSEPEFPREYMGQYLGRIGNVFSSSQVQTCIDLGEQYNTNSVPVSLYTLKSVGVDPGFSSSSTGIVVLEHIKTEDRHIIRVIDSILIDKGDPNKIVDLCWQIYSSNNYMNTHFFIDGSNAAMTNLLKIKFGESLNWQQVKDWGHNSNTKIRPISFNSEHKNMLSNLHAVVTKGLLAIPEKHSQLLTSLRTAWATELDLDKKQTSYNDILDALRLSLKAYNFE
jgi:Terminase large subunit, T4likevirus-type, N-terminal